MDGFPTWLLPIIEPIIKNLIKEAVTSAAAKAVLVTVLEDVKGFFDLEEQKVHGSLKPIADEVREAVDGAIDGVEAVLK